MSDEPVPDDIAEAMSDILGPAGVRGWWTAPNQTLGGNRPCDLWANDKQGQEKIRQYIQMLHDTSFS